MVSARRQVHFGIVGLLYCIVLHCIALIELVPVTSHSGSYRTLAIFYYDNYYYCRPGYLIISRWRTPSTWNLIASVVVFAVLAWLCVGFVKLFAVKIAKQPEISFDF